VRPRRLVLATMLSLGFVAWTVILVGCVITALLIGKFLALLPFILPMGLAWGRIVVRRVINQWDFRLSATSCVLRVQRGLLARNAQTLPFHRIQGVATIAPALWRLLGWQRLEVDVAGYHGSSEHGASEHGASEPSTTLLPVAGAGTAADVTERVVPGASDRPLRRATVDVHVTDGPVEISVRHLDAATARHEALDQLNRARHARSST